MLKQMYLSGENIVVLRFLMFYKDFYLCLFLCMSVCLHVYACTVCLQGYAMLEKATRGRQIRRTGVTDTCKPLCGR